MRMRISSPDGKLPLRGRRGLFLPPIGQLKGDDEFEDISIAIETYYGVDLSKCGVYRYASAMILKSCLLAYSATAGLCAWSILPAGNKSRKR